MKVYQKNLFPVVAFAVSLFLIVFAMVMARTYACTYFLFGVWLWLFAFGCYKGCLRILPMFLIVGGAFFGIAYCAYGDTLFALSMVNRLGGIFLAVAIGMSIQPVNLTRCLNQIKVPRSVTLGMLIATNFVPVLKCEISRVREAMKTRGCSILSPKVFYRAFLIPLVMRLVGISDTLALSVETRGFTLRSVPYTVYKKQNIALSDLFFMCGIILGAILVGTL